MLSGEAFAGLCERMLGLCKVTPAETVVVVSQGDERAASVDAFLAAAERVGATSFHMRLPNPSATLDGDTGVWRVGATPLAGNRPAVEALKRADIVVDVLFLLHSSELVEIQGSGTRILTCIEPPDVLARLFPDQATARRVDAAVAALDGARSLRVTSPAGTDVAYAIDAYPALGQYGYADRPGAWDHWPSTGIAYIYGADDGVDGRVVVSPGDILLPFKRYATSQIEFTIEAGRIREIGGGLDAEIVREYMAGFDDPDAYGLAHIGWGMNEAARWTALATDTRGHGMEVRAFAGNVLFSTGPNVQVDGPNATQCHIDVPMRGASLLLDDRAMVVDGALVEG